MNSSKLVLFLIAIILLVAVILSSNKIGLFLRSRFGKFLPANQKSAQGLSPTPTKIQTAKSGVNTDNKQNIPGGNSGINGNISNEKISLNGEIPATGPEMLFWPIIAGSFAGGLGFIRFSGKKKL